MELNRKGSQPSSQGPAENFTGTVRVEPVPNPAPPSRVRAALVTFEPGARSNWHTHPLGQTLIVREGLGLVQSWGGPVHVLRPGDIVSCPPNEKHWHGASSDSAMWHYAIQEELDGRMVDWLEPVTDEQYRRPPESD